jgi:iron(II)-dependent oxidoreductase
MKGLAKNIGQRYPSCARFVDAIKSNVVTTSHINQLPSQPNITAPTLVFNRGETAINGNTKVYERPNPSLPQLTKKIERNDGAINIGTPVKQRLSVKSIVIFSVSFLLCMIIIIAVGNKSKPSISENSNNTPSTPVDTPSNTVSPSIKNNDRTTTVVTTKTPVSLNNTTTDTKTDINTNKTILSPSTIVYNDTLKTNPKDGAEMVLITAGEFIMGSTDYEKDALAHEKPQRKVYLDAYYMYKTEVTVSQYRKFCAATGWKMPVAPNWGWKENHPIVNVTWNDSKAYSEWANASLPTEAQWEKAARGTDGRIFPWGNDWENGAKCVNWTSSTKPVGSILAGASPYGMLDMAGNVWEWCIDWYGSDYYKTALAKNPTGPTSGDYRVLRGGSWNGNGCSSYFYGYNRCACRFNYYPINYIDGYIGFRCTFPIQ